MPRWRAGAHKQVRLPFRRRARSTAVLAGALEKACCPFGRRCSDLAGVCAALNLCGVDAKLQQSSWVPNDGASRENSEKGEHPLFRSVPKMRGQAFP